MENRLLSVIITTYKREFELLRQSIDSVLNQTYSNIELIISDDNGLGSPISEALKKGLAENYPQVTYLPMRKNSGACAARNAGILASNGDFVGFLDDDDLWTKDKCEKQMKAFADPEVGLVFCEGRVFSGDDLTNTKPYYTSTTFFTSPTYDDMLWIDRVGSTSQAIIRKECFCYCEMFDSKLPARQDYDMWLRITRQGYKAIGIPEPLFFHRLHAGEQITKVPRKALEANLRLYWKYGKDFKKNKKAYFTLLSTIGGHYGACGQPLKKMWYLMRAMLVDPSMISASRKYNKTKRANSFNNKGETK